jgi:ammonium transporter, Amt family
MDINSGDTAWVLISTALVLLMTPGVALFYGGMVRAKSVLNMMMMSLASAAIVTMLWVSFGFSMAFGDSETPFFGSFELSNLGSLINEITVNGGEFPIPLLLFVAFQLMFAIITVALISGAIADRTKFSSWILFVGIWSVIVYFPVANWVFDFGNQNGDGAGWLAALGVIDFAGGTAVHINAGAAALALTLVIGRRIGFKRDAMRPHSLPLVLLGAALLWFGWFGFNAGSALSANGSAALAVLNTQVAAASALAGWLVVERVRDGHSTTLGAASGVVAGLVAITPACVAVDPIASIAIGMVAGALCAYAVGLKFRFNYDDSLDVVGVHLVAGLWGTLAIGIFNSDGLLSTGSFDLLIRQAFGAITVLLYSFVLTFIIAWLLMKTVGLRISEESEIEGVDLSTHAESAYDIDTRIGGSGTLSGIIKGRA